MTLQKGKLTSAQRKVVEEILRLYRRRQPLNEQARRFFRTWEAAVEEA